MRRKAEIQVEVAIIITKGIQKMPGDELSFFLNSQYACCNTAVYHRYAGKAACMVANMKFPLLKCLQQSQ